MSEEKSSKNKTIWTIIRTVMFFVVGLMNTAFIRPEDIGTWKNYVGYLFLLLAVIDTVILVKNFLQKKKT